MYVISSLLSVFVYTRRVVRARNHHVCKTLMIFHYVSTWTKITRSVREENVNHVARKWPAIVRSIDLRFQGEKSRTVKCLEFGVGRDFYFESRVTTNGGDNYAPRIREKCFVLKAGIRLFLFRKVHYLRTFLSMRNIFFRFVICITRSQFSKMSANRWSKNV